MQIQWKQGKQRRDGLADGTKFPVLRGGEGRGGEQDLRSNGGRGSSVHFCLRLVSLSPPDHVCSPLGGDAAIETPGSQPYGVAIRVKGELFVSSATHDSQEGLGALLGQRTHWIFHGAGSLRH